MQVILWKDAQTGQTTASNARLTVVLHASSEGRNATIPSSPISSSALSGNAFIPTRQLTQ